MNITANSSGSVKSSSKLGHMYDVETRKRALALVGQGRSLNSVGKLTGVSRAAIREWQIRIEPLRHPSECMRCGARPTAPSPAPYAYLLGLYLGDGCISAQTRGGYTLRIACADAWPGLIVACEGAIRSVRPGSSVCRVRCEGCTAVSSYDNHWPCLFPQHGEGKKHERPIILQPWQQAIVDEHPWEFIRGLIHSDGSRVTNWTEKIIGGERKRYEYPRYFFTNTSVDILRLFTDALDRVGVGWTPARNGRSAQNISIARRPSIALMDRYIGPKY